MSHRAEELIPTRASLLERLRDWQDQASWQDFFDTYWKLIYCVARKAGLTEVEAQDVVSEAMAAVARHMPTFRYDPSIGSFKGWLLNLTRWRIIDQLRKRSPVAVHRPASDPATGTATVDRIPDPAPPELDRMWEEDWQANLLEVAITNVKRRMDPKNFQIFDFYVNKNWAPADVAAAFGVTVDHVYLAKNRVTKMIKEEVQRLEKEMT